jgi:hypothetical protein
MMLHLSELQKKIDEAAEEMRHIAQDIDQGHRPQQRDLRQEGPSHDDMWYDDFHHDNIAFDDASSWRSGVLLKLVIPLLDQEQLHLSRS